MEQPPGANSHSHMRQIVGRVQTVFLKIRDIHCHLFLQDYLWKISTDWMQWECEQKNSGLRFTYFSEELNTGNIYLNAREIFIKSKSVSVFLRLSHGKIIICILQGCCKD